MKKTIKKLGITILTTSIMLYSSPLYALTKEETVYVKLNTNGTTKNIFVNEHLKNTDNQTELIDKTDLKNIININGKEIYKLDGNSITWDTKGNDIFYKGDTEKELPIKTEIKYYLNNEEKNIDEILGQSGNVKISIKFTNTDSHKVNVNGTYETLYTPFVITSSLILNGTDYKDIKVNNGKVINNGINNIILAINTPGLYESLKLNELKNLDTLDIEFTTTKFELPNIYSIATPKIFDKEDLKIFDKVNNLYSETNLLKTSIDEIEKGSALLVDASGKLNEGTKLIYDNLNTVVKSLEDLNNGAVKIDAGLKEILKNLEGTKNLLTSLNPDELNQLITANEQTIEQLSINPGTNADLIRLLTKNNEVLTKINTLANTLTPVINNLEKYLTELENGSKQISDGTQKLKIGVEVLTEKTGELNSGMTALLNGTQNLYNGIHTFNTEGITKINDLVNGQIKDIHKRLKELSKLSDSYDTFTMKNEDTESSTKFILNIESKKQKETKPVIKQTKEKTSLWTKIKNLFK